MKGYSVQTSHPASSDDASYFDRAVKWLRLSNLDSRWIRWAFVVGTVLYFVCLAMFETGPINRFSSDVFILLDGGWRILNGQVPHRDFYVALGPLEYMITAGGMLLTHGSPRGIAIGNVVFGITVGFWGWYLSRKRMPAILGLMVTAWLILTATSPTPLGLDAKVLSCAMIYNRHGYALLGIVLVECAFASERSRFLGGFSSGVALVLLGFLKLNFFGAAGLLLLASVPVRREEMNRLWGFLLGAACTFGMFLVYLRFAIAAFFADMLLAMQARSGSLGLVKAVSGICKCADAEIAWVAAIVTVVAVLLIARGKLWQRQTVRVALLGGLVLATGPMFAETNAGESGCPLATLWVILLLGMLAAVYSQCSQKAAIATAIVLALGGVFANFSLDAHSMLVLMLQSTHSERSSGANIEGHGIDSLRFYDGDDYIHGNEEDGHSYVAYLNEGLELLAKSSSPQETILSPGFHNPFSYILRRKPALGGSLWLLLDNNISRTHTLQADRVFGNADLIMFPNSDTNPRESDLFIQSTYQSYFSQHFDFVARSKSWLLYRRKR